MYIYHKNIPTYNAYTKKWTVTSFENQKEFADYLFTYCFKDCGEYEFDESTLEWNTLGKKFMEEGLYTNLQEKTDEWKLFWKEEELKCRLGLLWHSNNKTWYLTRCYYDLLNFCPIINKEKGQIETFADIRDTNYHLALYIKLAELYHKHAAIVKKRQMLNSYYMVAKSKNYLWFEAKKTIKWFASDKMYIDDIKGSWKILNAYKNHLLKHTPWDRAFTPDAFPEIQQIEKVKDRKTNRWTVNGNESTIAAFSTKMSTTNGVGGPLYFGWYEEGGIASTADETKTYLDPALESGNETVGIFAISGSVGDLTDCEPLKRMIENPDNYNIFKVKNKWIDDTGIVKETGLFIPTQYGYPQAVDKYGNSLISVALDLLEEQDINWKKLDKKQYNIKKSQNPKNLKEAFDYRDEGEFDSRKIQRRQDVLIELSKMNNSDFKPIKCVLEKDKDGKIVYNTRNLPEEIGYPIKKEMVDKRGVTIIYEPPIKNAPMFTYFAGVDPVEVGNSVTSSSIFSISIWKSPSEEEYYDENGNLNIKVTGDKLVACWRGRYNTIDKTNDYAELLIRHYNTYVLAERNKPNFINHFMRKGLTHLLARESELPIFKDMPIKTEASQYGFYKGANGKASEVFNQFIEKFKEYLYVEYGHIYKKDEDGNNTLEVIKTFTGLDRIDDYWFLEELKMFRKNNMDNYDRIISDFAGYYIMKLYNINRGTTKIRVASKEKQVRNEKPTYNWLDYNNKFSENNVSNLLKY